MGDKGEVHKFVPIAAACSVILNAHFQTPTLKIEAPAGETGTRRAPRALWSSVQQTTDYIKRGEYIKLI